MRLSGNYGIGDGGKSTSNDVRSQSEVSAWPSTDNGKKDSPESDPLQVRAQLHP